MTDVTAGSCATLSPTVWSGVRTNDDVLARTLTTLRPNTENTQSEKPLDRERLARKMDSDMHTTMIAHTDV